MDTLGTFNTWSDLGVPDGIRVKGGFPGLTGDSDVTPVIQFAPVDAYTAWGIQQGKVNNGQQNNHTTQVTQGFDDRPRQEAANSRRAGICAGWRTFAHDLATTNGTYVFARNRNRAAPVQSHHRQLALVSFLLGLPDSASAARLLGSVGRDSDTNTTVSISRTTGARQSEANPKLRDCVTTSHTVNWYAADVMQSSISLTEPNPGANNYPGAYIFAGNGPNRSGMTRFSGRWISTDLGPQRRICTVSGSIPKTVLRGGFGIFYEATSNGGCGCTLAPVIQFSQISDGLNAPFQWDGGLPKPVGYQPPPNLSPSVGNGTAVDSMAHPTSEKRRASLLTASTFNVRSISFS